MPPDPLDDWDFPLPDSQIARFPPEARDGARLLHVPRRESGWSDRSVLELPDLLRGGDLLVANDSRVLHARLAARRTSGGAVEVLLLGPGPGEVEALIRPARKVKDGEVLDVPGAGTITVVRRDADAGTVWVTTDPSPLELMERAGDVPLPPYLGRAAVEADRERYQTVFAGPPGSSAAPTAGLHLSPALLSALAARGVGFATVTLHVGIGTFRPLRPEDVVAGRLHPEPWTVPAATAERIAATRAAGGRVIAVGTTATRTLASAADADGCVRAGSGVTTCFLKPPDTIPAVDGLLTNFHLPRSSLLMLVACLVGRDRLMAAYAHAVSNGYRFFSYGDAMLLL